MIVGNTSNIPPGEFNDRLLILVLIFKLIEDHEKNNELLTCGISQDGTYTYT